MPLEPNQYHVAARLDDGTNAVVTVNNATGDSREKQIAAAKASVEAQGHQVISVETDHAVAASKVQQADQQTTTQPAARPTPPPPPITPRPATNA